MLVNTQNEKISTFMWFFQVDSSDDSEHEEIKEEISKMSTMLQLETDSVYSYGNYAFYG